MGKLRKAINNSIEANKYVKPYSAVDGRVYNTEPDGRKLNIRPDVVRNMSYSENRISLIDIWKIEWFLTHDSHCNVQEQRRLEKLQPAMTEEDKRRIISEYSLSYIKCSKRYDGNPDYIYSRLCDKFPRAIQYKKYKGLVYAVKFGESKTLSFREDSK